MAELAKKALQPGQFVSPGARIRIPEHQGDVMPAQRIADRGAGRVDVDVLLACQNLAHSQRPDAVLVLQPSFAFVLIHDDHLLGDPVDVIEQRCGDRIEHCKPFLGPDLGGPHFPEDKLVQAALTQPVCAHKRVDRHAMLGEPSRVLECRGRGFDALDRDIVPQRVQKGLHVPFDARIEQLDDSRIAAQLGDLVLEGVANERRDLGQPLMNALSGRRDQAAYVTRRRDPVWSPHDGRSWPA